MVRLILAAIGILFLYIGSNGYSEATLFGICFLLPAGITVIWKIYKGIRPLIDEFIWVFGKKKREKANADTIKAQEDAEYQMKQDLLKQQQDLVEKYKNSPVTIEMLRVICGGFPPVHFPTKITIFNNYVQSETSTQKRTYDFAQHRIHSLEWVFKIVHKREDLKYVVKPQIAMAQAINALLSNKYQVSDYAKENMNFKTDSDGDSYTTITYESDHVVMVLKDTLPNRTF